MSLPGIAFNQFRSSKPDQYQVRFGSVNSFLSDIIENRESKSEVVDVGLNPYSEVHIHDEDFKPTK
jgi:hypothetical protein